MRLLITQRHILFNCAIIQLLFMLVRAIIKKRVACKVCTLSQRRGGSAHLRNNFSPCADREMRIERANDVAFQNRAHAHSASNIYHLRARKIISHLRPREKENSRLSHFPTLFDFMQSTKRFFNR